mmetsp:Transcript_40914/g.61812  ORF Transcript_40914/g.61812 Transcript_40914/m.61812 type:complete len:203 (+) Transcript_40914:217-825(+)
MRSLQHGLDTEHSAGHEVLHRRRDVHLGHPQLSVLVVPGSLHRVARHVPKGGIGGRDGQQSCLLRGCHPRASGELVQFQPHPGHVVCLREAAERRSMHLGRRVRRLRLRGRSHDAKGGRLWHRIGWVCWLQLCPVLPEIVVRNLLGAEVKQATRGFPMYMYRRVVREYVEFLQLLQSTAPTKQRPTYGMTEFPPHPEASHIM